VHPCARLGTHPPGRPGPGRAGFFSLGTGTDTGGRYRLTRLVTRLRAVNAAAGYVDLERPLPFNVSTAWAPRLLQYAPRYSMNGRAGH
jgi:hypothetical protein